MKNECTELALIVMFLITWLIGNTAHIEDVLSTTILNMRQRVLSYRRRLISYNNTTTLTRKVGPVLLERNTEARASRPPGRHTLTAAIKTTGFIYVALINYVLIRRVEPTFLSENRLKPIYLVVKRSKHLGCLKALL